uniref:Uncharacterized protein n=1 Tax=Steinernema glaseri TaxID=37863 RepID=A0A1I8A1T4_9BILA
MFAENIATLLSTRSGNFRPTPTLTVLLAEISTENHNPPVSVSPPTAHPSAQWPERGTTASGKFNNFASVALDVRSPIGTPRKWARRTGTADDGREQRLRMEQNQMELNGGR